MAAKNMLRFDPKSHWGKTLHEWHESLEGDRGSRAALRSSASPVDVVFVQAYHTLFHALADHGKTAIEQGKIYQSRSYIEHRLHDRLPVIAGLIALIEESPPVDERSGRPLTPAQQMGRKESSGSRSRVSGLRFRRLLKCRAPEDLYPAMRRIIRLLNKEMDIHRLANDVFYWNEEQRKQWAYDYYAAAPKETE